MSSQALVGRLAPSPTGGLHLGHARTFLIAWLAAKSAGGRILLRIEDIDSTRVRSGATEGVIADLNWLGLSWDEGPYVQSERIDVHRGALERLKRKGLVYPCVCTRKEIERAASAPHAGEEGPVYPGTCAGRSAEDGDGFEAAGRAFAWRFRTPSDEVVWNDLFMGPRSFAGSALGGDFILARSPFTPSYQLAATLDDAHSGVTQVVRGDDLAPSTPRQILLHRAWGFDPPTFGHVPLVHDEEGRRLAKRDGAIKLSTLRESGVSSEDLIGRFALSCGWSSDGRPIRPEALLGRFRWDSIPAEPLRWDRSPSR